MFLKSFIALMAVFFSVLAYAHTPSAKKKVITYCKEPRPQMCTMDYTPVCALVDKTAVKTFGNACGACSNNNVSAYIANECQVDSLKQFTLTAPTKKKSIH